MSGWRRVPARFAERGDMRLAYYQFGPETGPPLVLCHGLAAAGMQFFYDADWFADRGFRVIVPDLRGHGLSKCPPDRRDEDFTIEQLAQDMQSVLDHAGVTEVDWVGNSLGGIIALELMAVAPERLKSLTTFGTAYSLNVPRIAIPAMRLAFATINHRLIARITANMTCPPGKGRMVVFTILRDMDADVIVRIGRHVRHYDLIGNALGFDKPILMIRGDRDRAVNRALGPTLKAMQDRPNFTLVDLPDAGHCANLDQWDRFREIIADSLSTATATGNARQA